MTYIASCRRRCISFMVAVESWLPLLQRAFPDGESGSRNTLYYSRTKGFELCIRFTSIYFSTSSGPLSCKCHMLRPRKGSPFLEAFPQFHALYYRACVRGRRGALLCSNSFIIVRHRGDRLYCFGNLFRLCYRLTFSYRRS